MLWLSKANLFIYASKAITNLFPCSHYHSVIKQTISSDFSILLNPIKFYLKYLKLCLCRAPVFQIKTLISPLRNESCGVDRARQILAFSSSQAARAGIKLKKTDWKTREGLGLLYFFFLLFCHEVVHVDGNFRWLFGHI